MKTRFVKILAALAVLVSIFLTPVWAEEASKFTLFEVWSYIEDEYVKPIPDSAAEIYKELQAKILQPDAELSYADIKRLVKAVGCEHTMFMDPELTEEFNKWMRPTYVGIGCLVRKDKDKFILEPLFETPADKAGVKKGDELLDVDGKDVQGLSLDEIVKLIKGKGIPLTWVTLTVRHGEEILEDKVQRRELFWELNASYEMVDGIGVVKLYHFHTGADYQMWRIAQEMLSQGVDRMVLDLRYNPGGILEIMANIAALWTDGTVVIVKSKKKSEFISGESHPYPLLADFKTVVLINKYSASASEVLAAALDEYNRATTVGETTFGKGTVQDVHKVEQGKCLLKLTTAFWLTPELKMIDGQGVEPDIHVENTKERDLQMEKAMELLNSK